MWRNYLSIAIAIGGSLLLSVVALACGTATVPDTDPTAIARGVEDALAATAAARPPTSTPAARRESVPGWLVADTENITLRMNAIQPYLHSCPFTTSERSSYIRRLERFTADAFAIADDMNDGFIDDYDIEELVSITNDGFEIVSELELKCK